MNTSMHNIEEAQDILQVFARNYFSSNTNQNIETLTIAGPQVTGLLNRVLAQDIISPINAPEFDNSAMDGYALHTSGVQFSESSLLSNSISIVGEASAGAMPPKLYPNTCMRIFTGAPIPEGANSVVAQELCTVNEQDNTIQIQNSSAVTCGDNIRPYGLNFIKGDVICKKGTAINGGLLTVLASLGIIEILVYQKLSIALCVTGDELQTPGTVLELGKIYDSNTVLICQLCVQLGASLDTFCRLSDDYEQTQTQLHSLSKAHDIVICTGGVSVGDKDFIQKVLLQDGTSHIHKVSIKPGKPFSFFSLHNTPFLCLPGNPLAVYITFLWFVVPFIQQMQGLVTPIIEEVPNSRTLLSAISPQTFQPYPRTQFIFCNIHYLTMQVDILLEQSSAALKNIMMADGAIIIPKDQHINQGDRVLFFPFSQIKQH